MFDYFFIVPTRFDFKILSEYKNIIPKLFFAWKRIIGNKFFI